MAFPKRIVCKNILCINMNEIISILELNGGIFKYRTITHQNKLGTVFFFHGLGDKGSTFSSQISYLNDKGYECIYFDFPGCGENWELCLAPGNIVSLLTKLVENNLTEKTLLVGHSLGGFYVLRAAFSTHLNHKIDICVSESTLLGIDLCFFESIKTDGSKPAERFSRLLSLDHLPETYLDIYRNNLASINTRMFLNYIDDVVENLREVRKTIFNKRINFVYCFGENSPAQTERLDLGKSEYIKIRRFESSGHWLHIEQPEKFNGVLCNMLG